MTEYVNMWRNFANFHDRTTVRGYWMAFLINFLIAMGISLLMAVIPLLVVVEFVYGLAVLVPSISIIVRRLRDAGKGWYHIFWAVLPLIGTIILIILLIKPSIEPDLRAVV